MAVTNFVPQIWSARLLSTLEKKLVAVGACNRDYEGDATGGSVNITSITDPTIGTYSGSEFTHEAITDATRSLALDQKKYFDVVLDDVERAQSVDGGRILQEAVDKAAYGLAKVMDTYVLAAMAADASASAPDHQVAEATISTASDAYDAMVAWSVLLDDADIPEEDRWAIVTPGFHGLLLKDSRFISAGDVAAATTRANGKVGFAAGFEVMKSTNLPDGAGAGAGKAMIAGYRGATTFAQQLQSVEAYRTEKAFKDGVKGLAVYGAKVTRSTGLVVADVIVG